jgi:uncharacterized protein (TIGR00730 family)
VESPSPIVAVFGASSTTPGDGQYEEAYKCGRLLAEAGFTVLTGGYGGSMHAASKGAADAGSHVIGVTAPAVFPGREGANAYVAEEIPAETLTGRIDAMIGLASAVIALDGSIGTLTELMIAWNAAFVARFSSSRPMPVVAVGAKWRAIVPDLARLLNTDGSLVSLVDDVDDAVRTVAASVRIG